MTIPPLPGKVRVRFYNKTSIHQLKKIFSSTGIYQPFHRRNHREETAGFAKVLGDRGWASVVAGEQGSYEAGCLLGEAELIAVLVFADRVESLVCVLAR